MKKKRRQQAENPSDILRRKARLIELYEQNPIAADRLVWGRTTGKSRRGFLQQSSLALMSLALGGPVVYARHFPTGLTPAGLLNADAPATIPGKHPDLVVLNDRPVNAETPAHLLSDRVTPAEVLFVRNNGLPPDVSDIDPSKWMIEIAGEAVSRPYSISLSELKERFTHHTYQLTIECGGNGRSEFQPPAKGNQWSTGAVGSPEWTGVRLADVLREAEIADDAVYIGYYGADTHLSGDPGKDPISRGVPLVKALEEHSMIAWAVNGEDMPLHNGHPVRLVFGGWPASCSGKWLTKIVVRDKVHDGEKMGGQSYRVPCEPVAPGTVVPDSEMCIIESMPVKSLITAPRTGAMIRTGQRMPVRGHAWAGEIEVASVELSMDFGQTWQPASVQKPVNKYAWQHFNGSLTFPEPGYYEVWARATDSSGVSQPMLLPGWNPKGYLNNACHRIAVSVQA